MQVIIEHRKASDTDSKVGGQQLESIFEPLFSVIPKFIGQNEGLPDTPGSTVIPAGYVYIDNIFPGSGHIPILGLKCPNRNEFDTSFKIKYACPLVSSERRGDQRSLRSGNRYSIGDG